MATPSQLEKCILRALFSGNVPFITSQPGIGKSSIVNQIAEKYKLEPVTIMLSLMDPTLISGFPKVEGNKTKFFPLDIFPLEDTPLPEGKVGWLIFFDEANTAAKLVQACAYRIILDRMVGSFKLNPKAYIVCAGNRVEDSALAEELSTAMQSRLSHFSLTVDVKEWLKWASENNLNQKVISFIGWKGLSALNNFDPDHSDKTFACCRTWHFVSNLLNFVGSDFDIKDLKEDIEGLVGMGPANEFVAYCGIFESLTPYEEIVALNGYVDLPSTVGVQYAYTSILGEKLTTDTISKVMPFILKFPPELQVLILRGYISKDIKNASNPLITEWSEKIGQQYF